MCHLAYKTAKFNWIVWHLSPFRPSIISLSEIGSQSLHSVDHHFVKLSQNIFMWWHLAKWWNKLSTSSQYKHWSESLIFQCFSLSRQGYMGTSSCWRGGFHWFWPQITAILFRLSYISIMSHEISEDRLTGMHGYAQKTCTNDKKYNVHVQCSSYIYYIYQ